MSILAVPICFDNSDCVVGGVCIRDFLGVGRCMCSSSCPLSEFFQHFLKLFQLFRRSGAMCGRKKHELCNNGRDLHAKVRFASASLSPTKMCLSTVV